MEIRFTRLSGNRHEINARDRRGPDVRLPARPAGPIPHDLVHAVVERALELTEGFWDAIAGGATFEGFEPVEPGRHRRSGPKLLRRKGAAVMDADLVVAWTYRIWTGLPVTGRGIPAAPVDAAAVEPALVALDEAAKEWDALPEGESLVWRWPGR